MRTSCVGSDPPAPVRSHNSRDRACRLGCGRRAGYFDPSPASPTHICSRDASPTPCAASARRLTHLVTCCSRCPSCRADTAGDRPDIPDDAPLTGFELRAFSQNGEDGVLLELLRRAGEGSRTFVEFGATVARTRRSFLRTCSAGPVCTSEGDAARAARLQAKYADTAIEVKSEIVTPDTIDDIFESAGVPAEPDVLSIDVDGPDYWIWSGLQRHRPRILLIEYKRLARYRQRARATA